MNMSNVQKGILYAVYIILVMTFCLFYLFPVDAVTKYMSFALTETIPGINITLKKARPAFPAALRLQAVEFYYRRSLLLTAEQVKIVPYFTTLFFPPVKFAFKGRTYGGIVEGRGKFTAKQADHKATIDARLAGIQVEEIAVLQNLAGRRIEGLLEGQIKYDSGTTSGDNLSAEFVMSECIIELLTPVFNIGNVNFSKIETDVVVNKHKLQLKQCNFKGKQMDGTLSGFITLNNPLKESLISLSGTIKPHPVLLENLNKVFPANKKWQQSGLPIRLNGTIEKPVFFLQ